MSSSPKNGGEIPLIVFALGIALMWVFGISTGWVHFVSGVVGLSILVALFILQAEEYVKNGP